MNHFSDVIKGFFVDFCASSFSWSTWLWSHRSSRMSKLVGVTLHWPLLNSFIVISQDEADEYNQDEGQSDRVSFIHLVGLEQHPVMTTTASEKWGSPVSGHNFTILWKTQRWWCRWEMILPTVLRPHHHSQKPGPNPKGSPYLHPSPIPPFISTELSAN